MLPKRVGALIGHLNHACKVIRPGRLLLRRMINLLHDRSFTPYSKFVPICLNQEFRADLTWWTTFAVQKNGTSFFPLPQHITTYYIFSDASGAWGCGAWTDHLWFQLQWSPLTTSLQIATKELLPMVLGCAVWGRSWATCHIVWNCDNHRQLWHVSTHGQAGTLA